MKQILNWLHQVQSEISPFFVSALFVIMFNQLFMSMKINLIDFIRLSIIAFFATGAAYWFADTNNFPYPIMASIAGGVIGTPIIAGAFNLLNLFRKNPKDFLLTFFTRFKK